MPNFKAVIEFIKEGIAPSRCVGCGINGTWLCNICASQIIFVREQVCYRCGQLSKYGRTCKRCRSHTALSGVTVTAYFDEGPVRELIHELKYGGITDVAVILGEMLALVARDNFRQGGLIVPMPLHLDRLAKRGFNQAELLAMQLNRRLGWKVDSILTRVRPTRSQTELTRFERAQNVAGAFRCRVAPEGAPVILVDDVMTTGATLEECAVTLKKAGAKRVWALVVARG